MRERRYGANVCMQLTRPACLVLAHQRIRRLGANNAKCLISHFLVSAVRPLDFLFVHLKVSFTTKRTNVDVKLTGTCSKRVSTNSLRDRCVASTKWYREQIHLLILAAACVYPRITATL